MRIAISPTARPIIGRFDQLLGECIAIIFVLWFVSKFVIPYSEVR